MIRKIEAAAVECLAQWRAYEKELNRAGFGGPLKATAIGWKVADYDAYLELHDQLLPLCDQVHTGTVNDRLIGSFILKKPVTKDQIRIIKVLQRRPGSSDPLGLDHVDFFCADVQKARQVLVTTKAHWQAEHNDVHAWLSVRFGKDLADEAKLVDHVVLDAAITEMQLAKDLL